MMGMGGGMGGGLEMLGRKGGGMPGGMPMGGQMGGAMPPKPMGMAMPMDPQMMAMMMGGMGQRPAMLPDMPMRGERPDQPRGGGFERLGRRGRR